MKTKFEELIEKIKDCREFAKDNGLALTAMFSDKTKVGAEMVASEADFKCHLKVILNENPYLIVATYDAAIETLNTLTEQK